MSHKKSKTQHLVRQAAAGGGLPRLYTIKEAVAAFGSAGVTSKSLRREASAGRLKALRTRPAQNAKLIFSEFELLRWLREEASQRQYMPRGRKGVCHG